MIDIQKMAIDVRMVQTLKEFHLLQERWNSLLAESQTNSFFLRWEWLWTWWNVYKEDNYRLCILLVFRGDELIGIAPFYVINRLRENIFTIRRLMFLGTKEGSVISEYMDIIYREGHEEVVIRKIMDFIVKENICDDICLHKVDTSSRTIPILQQPAGGKENLNIVELTVESPYIILPSKYEDFLNQLGSSMKYKIRNHQRKLSKYSEVVFRKTENIAELERDFSELVKLHQLRWESRGLLGSFVGERFYLFQKTVMHDMLKNGHLDLWFLSVAGKHIAALYNIRYNNKIYFYQAGLDVTFDKHLSPGILLHNHCIEIAISDGLREYDFLLQGSLDAYKKSWTREYKSMCDIYVVRPGIMKFVMSARNKAKNAYHAICKKGLFR